MANLRRRSRLTIPAPPPSPIPTGRGSRSAGNKTLSHYLEKTSQVPELSLPEPHFPPIASQKIPESIDYRLLTSRSSDSLDRLLISAREFGAFRATCHGIDGEELRLLIEENKEAFRVRDEEDTVLRRDSGGGDERSDEEIVWVRPGTERRAWAREFVGTESHRSFRENTGNVSTKIERIAEDLLQIMEENIPNKQIRKRKPEMESVISFRRHKHVDIIEQTSPPTSSKNTNSKSSDYILSLILPSSKSKVSIQTESGPICFYLGPDTILATFGKQIEEWSLGVFKCVSGDDDMTCEPDLLEEASFTIQLKRFSLSSENSFERGKTISIACQMLIAFLLYNIFVFISSKA
ncbi:gibberellin 2-beta-dioxygenase 8-like [Tripterygium wilfordii]|uniref:Gibberellin 2-beta-dioxygenase 8-like n=1 Tax=Tripterygium wilfordii TaxID=458696 RepID=A0A7J7DXC1_TRIWF|nr:uncharacterized protein LOC119991155 [Tripterygium wilfordii]KAF5750746.1 gibberellin 2-beta-dioxygenase 8-like [Tripterygium wilfordii]